MAGVHSFDKQLSFFHCAMSMVASVLGRRRIMAPEQVLRELVSGVSIAQKIRVVKARAKLTHDRFRTIRHVLVFGPDESDCGLQHSSVSQRGGPGVIGFFQIQLTFEHQPLSIRQVELHYRNYFTGALAGSQIADREDSRIPPIRIVGGITFKRRNRHEWFEHAAQFLFADTFDESLKRFHTLTLPNVTLGENLDDFRNLFGWDSSNRQAVRSGIFLPFSAKNDLEMGNLTIAKGPARSIEQIGRASCRERV